MSDEALARAEVMLWDLLSSTEAIAPTDLLVRAAEARQPGLTAETLRLALWGLLSSRVVIQTGDHRLLRASEDTVHAAAKNVAVA